MDFQRWGNRISLLICCFMSVAYAGGTGTSPIRRIEITKAESQVPRMSAEELKAKLSRNEAVTVLDVRATDSYVNSSNRIRGSIHVKLRRLEFRLTLPPLRDVPRDSEVITYCACPHDEASIRAAQILIDAGFKRVHVLDGGWQAWLRANGQVEARPKA
jgi:rhodanese-related sulfurtransferase